MSYMDDEHKNRIKRINEYWKKLEELSEYAMEYGINDIFQDNEAKTLQQLIYLNFTNLDGREGNDGLDENETEWEMKSINTLTSASGFSTNHHLNLDIIAKYRKVPWSFSFYEGIKLNEIYVLSQKNLEPIYQKWENRFNTESITHLNNPKISIKFIRENGTLVYSNNSDVVFNPADVY